MKIENEQSSAGKYQMRYIYDKAKESYFANYLIVTFSAIPSIDSSIKHQYSFMKVLSDIPCHKLYMQDSLGEYGTYYLCENMDFEVANCVASVIEKIRVMHNIKKGNVICLGSSKGGTSAIYHGCKGDYGHVIAMGPQTKIADFLNQNKSNIIHQNIFYTMIGKTDFYDAYEKINDIVFESIKGRNNTKIHLLSSEKDAQFSIHIKPLLELLKYGSDELIIDNRILSHSDLANYNPHFVREKLFHIFLSSDNDYMETSYEYKQGVICCNHLQADIDVKKFNYAALLETLQISYHLTVFADEVTIKLIVSPYIDLMKFAFYAINEENTVKVGYSTNIEHTFFGLLGGTYRIKYYVKIGDDSKSYYTEFFQV